MWPWEWGGARVVTNPRLHRSQKRVRGNRTPRRNESVLSQTRTTDRMLRKNLSTFTTLVLVVWIPKNEAGCFNIGSIRQPATPAKQPAGKCSRKKKETTISPSFVTVHLRLTESDETVPSGTAPASSGKANGPKRASPPVHTHIVADHMAREPLRASVLAVASFAAAEEQERKQGPAVERAQPPCLLIFVPSS